MKYFSVCLVFFITYSVTTWAQTSPSTSPASKKKELRFQLNEDGSHYVKGTFLNQIWLRNTWTNPGSLYLWNGNYEQVVSLGMSFIYDGGSGRYKLGNDDYNGEWIQFFYRDPITKTRELINIVPFDYQRHQTNRLDRKSVV